ncbi:MAG: hypothetical protein AAGG69_14130 [Pseudomonadota bacterium]
MFFWLEGAIYTGTIPAIAIGFLIAETLLLLWLYRHYGRAAIIMANAFAGGAVMVGLYVLATGGSTLIVAALLIVSLIAHCIDLILRDRLFKQASRQGSSSKPAN